MIEVAEEVPKLSKRKLRSIVKNEEKTAQAAHLIYVSDKDPGIERRKNGETFEYYFDNKPVRDDEVLLRIKHLVIPPAWEKVWICKDENGHLQATGYDTKNRKQYKYHSAWNALRNETKYYRLHDFWKSLAGYTSAIGKRFKYAGIIRKKSIGCSSEFDGTNEHPHWERFL